MNASVVVVELLAVTAAFAIVSVGAGGATVIVPVAVAVPTVAPVGVDSVTVMNRFTVAAAVCASTVTDTVPVVAPAGIVSVPLVAT
jgi:hypothetical protein